MVTATGLVKALLIAGSSTESAVLLCLKSLHIVVLPVQLDMSGASLDSALLRNVANDAVAELAELRTDVFSGFEGAHTDDCVADQAGVTRGRANNQTNEEECFGVDAVEGLAELLNIGQLFGASAPVLVLVAAFDDTSRVSGIADDCSTVEDTVQIADRLARS